MGKMLPGFLPTHKPNVRADVRAFWRELVRNVGGVPPLGFSALVPKVSEALWERFGFLKLCFISVDHVATAVRFLVIIHGLGNSVSVRVLSPNRAALDLCTHVRYFSRAVYWILKRETEFQDNVAVPKVLR